MSTPTFREPPAGSLTCPGCGKALPDGRIACADDWRAVSARTRTQAIELVQTLGRGRAQPHLERLFREPTTQPQERGTHPCPACGRPVSDSYVACADDWQSLPADFRRQLTDAFRARTTDPDRYDRAVRALRERLRGPDA